MLKPFLKNYHFTAQDLNVLTKPQAWITGTIIDIFGHTFADCSDMLLQYISCEVSNFLNNETIMQQFVNHIVLSAKGFVIIPFSDNTHWNILLHDLHASTWKVFSSFSSVSQSVIEFLKKLTIYLPDHLKFDGESTACNVLNITLQTDGYHCGDFCLLFLELLSKGWDLDSVIKVMEYKTEWKHIIKGYRDILTNRLERFDVVDDIEFATLKRKRE